AGVIRTFQIVRLFNQLTAIDNVLVGFHLNTRGSVVSAVVGPGWFRHQEQRIRQEAHDLLSTVGLSGLASVAAGNLTGGQQKLLEIARALAAKPSLLLLDEPAAGLNTIESRELMSLIRQVRERGTTILLVEHDMSLVMNVADVIHVLDFGELIARGRPEEIQAHPAVIEAYLGGIGNVLKGGSAAHV